MKPKWLFLSWMEYVSSARFEEGFPDTLSNASEGYCYCRKSRTSFPHWPPTSFGEAWALYENCFKEDNLHRKYLAYCWWVFANSRATFHPGKSTPQRLWYQREAEEIRAYCPAVNEELNRDKSIPERPREWSCQVKCAEILRWNDGCTCYCNHHRDECPTHRWWPGEVVTLLSLCWIWMRSSIW
jgi:hypothetical protein